MENESQQPAVEGELVNNEIVEAIVSANAVLDQARAYVASVDAYVIDSPAMFEVAAEEMRLIRDAEKRLDEERDGRVRPLNTTVKEINRVFKEPAELLERAKKSLSKKMIEFEDAATAQRKANESVVTTFDMAADATPIPVAQQQVSRGGHARRENYIGEIENMPALLRHVADSLEKGELTFVGAVTIKPGTINALGNATKGAVTLPGVKWIINKQMVARS